MSKLDDQTKVAKLVIEWSRLNPSQANESIRRHEIEHRLIALKKSGKLKKLL